MALKYSLAIVAVVAGLVASVAAQTKTTIFNFPGGGRGSYPVSGLVADKQGNLYGATLGDSNIAFRLSKTGGKWTETVLHVFGTQQGDGFYPYGKLIFDGKGNMFGTTAAGGEGGFGTVYEISPNGVGGWTETVIYAFSDAGGKEPNGGVMLDGLGNLYGTTSQGGSTECGWKTYVASCGSVFKLTPGASGWAFSNLYYFAPTLTRADGVDPVGSLYEDAHHNLYGTTVTGGTGSGGTVFELSAAKGGGFRDTLLYSFDPPYDSGLEPTTGLVADASGNLYGTTEFGGANGVGAVFELSLTANGWQEQAIYSFQGGSDGENPLLGNLVFDASGNLYGVTASGGFNSSCTITLGCGTVYELSPVAGGGWAEKVLYAFQGGVDGETPYGPVVVDSAGNVFGTTSVGGAQNWGTVFEITP